MICLAPALGACGLIIKDPFSRPDAKLASGDMISRADALEDLSTLMRLLENVHADPYRFQPRPVVEAQRRRVAESMPASLTRSELCLRLSSVAAVLDDGHTGLSCEELVRNEWSRAASATPPESQRMLLFPPFIRVDDQQHLTVGWHNGSPGLDPGDRILRVNGQDADALLAEWAAQLSHETDAGRRARVARRFRLFLTLHGINAPYRLTVAPPGGPSREVTIEGLAVNYQFQAWPTIAARPNVTEVTLPPAPPTVFKPIQLENDFFAYRMIEPDIAYMNFYSTLSGVSTVSRFRKAVAAMFQLVAKDRPRSLIIDIRENGGGEDSVASELLRHLTEKPFRFLESTRIKRSQEARDFANSIIRIPFRWMGLPYLVAEGRAYVAGKVGSLSPPLERPVRTYPRAEPFFDGPVCVLTGPHTYSAGVAFAEAVKLYGLATIVGEETGGQPNSFGNNFAYALPRSRLAVQVATATSVRASGSLTDFSPVIPDIVVRTTQADMRRGFDPVLERAKNCPARAIR